MEIETNENNAIIRQQLLQQLQPRVHHAQPLVVAGQVLALFADNRAQPLLDLRVIDIIVVDPALVAGVVWRIYKDIIFDTKPIARKVYKNSENRTFLAVFAVFVVIRLAPSDPTRSVADTVDVAPVRLAQGIIK